MGLDLFNGNHVRRLVVGVRENLPRYQEKSPWADRASAGAAPRLSSNLEPAVPLELELPEGKNLKDLENTKLVYQAFPNLTPLQARDPRLWTRLTHVECWSYMRKRWAVEDKLQDPEKAQRYVLAHYFVPQAQSRALLRNGIARLWWYAHLTHDPVRADPFELNAVLLSYLDIAQQLLERNMGRAPQVRTGFLDFIRSNGGRLGATSNKRRESIRKMAILLNLRGGVTLLDCLTCSEIAAILSDELRLDDGGNSNGKQEAAALPLAVGTVVLCSWKGKPAYYQGKIAEVNGDRIFIAYDDGDTEWTTANMIQPMVHVNSLAPGTVVLCRWNGGAAYYKGKIAIAEIDGGQIQIVYEDGHEELTTADMVQKWFG